MRFTRFCVSSILLLFFLSFLVSDAVLAKGKSRGYRYKGGKAIDGDTFKYKGTRYRLRDVYAPEKGQPGWKKAQRDLQQKLDSGKYKWEPVAKDKYRRPIVKERKE